ncbi:MAG: formate--tetrahydrofolate ligase [Candidatus Micrarchaeia archaeon]
MKTDIEIAQKAKMRDIRFIAKKVGIRENELELHGRYIAKVRLEIFRRLRNRGEGSLIIVSAMTPTSAGEGKTTTTISLADALWLIGKKAIATIREPSLGPVFGVKGGGAGGGYSQVLPMEDINLHFVGDMHAVSSAHNLLAAMVDNHMHHGNELNIDPTRMVWGRVMDMNDRVLRQIVVGLGGSRNGIPHEDHFAITAASEVMAILCLSKDYVDLKDRLGRITVAYDRKGNPIYASQLRAHGAMAALLRNAMKPNLVQSIGGSPIFVHGGPFANIAHGTNSIIATKMALKLVGRGGFVITETGFGTDLGMEKFMNMVARVGEFVPNVVVLAATVRALRYHGGADDVKKPSVDCVRRGLANLEKHMANVMLYGLPIVVAINRFEGDTEEEYMEIFKLCKRYGVNCVVSDAYRKGGKGTIDLAKAVVKLCGEGNYTPIYSWEDSISKKIEIIAKKMYGAKGVEYTPLAKERISEIEARGLGNLPICVAKTNLSLSDKSYLRGRPEDFVVTVMDIKPMTGAGFVVVLLGDIVVMPGLPKRPAAENIDIREDGTIVGLF